MSALVVMMLMLYALMVALALMLWAALNLRGRRPAAPPIDESAQSRRDDLPEVPAAFAAKPAPATEVRSVRAEPRAEVGRRSRTADSGGAERRGVEPQPRASARVEPQPREVGRRDPPARQATPAATQTPTTPNEGRGSFSRLRVVHRRDDDAPEKEPERDDAFERFRTAKDDIDF